MRSTFPSASMPECVVLVALQAARHARRLLEVDPQRAAVEGDIHRAVPRVLVMPGVPGDRQRRLAACLPAGLPGGVERGEAFPVATRWGNGVGAGLVRRMGHAYIAGEGCKEAVLLGVASNWRVTCSATPPGSAEHRVPAPPNCDLHASITRRPHRRLPEIRRSRSCLQPAALPVGLDDHPGNLPGRALRGSLHRFRAPFL